MKKKTNFKRYFKSYSKDRFKTGAAKIFSVIIMHVLQYNQAISFQAY